MPEDNLVNPTQSVAIQPSTNGCAVMVNVQPVS